MKHKFGKLGITMSMFELSTFMKQFPFPLGWVLSRHPENYEIQFQMGDPFRPYDSAQAISGSTQGFDSLIKLRVSFLRI